MIARPGAWPLLLLAALAASAQGEDAKPIRHGFLATGAATYLRDADGKTTWTYPQSSRDGWVLPGGNVLLALSRGKAHPGGAVVEVAPDGSIAFAFEGTQAEVNTVQDVGEGRILLTEAGDRPRLLEVDRSGQIRVEVPLKAQTKDHHLQTRMARKLDDGHYLVPQLLDKVVREYTGSGEVVWEAKTPDMPFTAIRLPDGHTLIGCTVGNLAIEVDRSGSIVWQVSNDDLPGRPLKDVCGVQRLPNGNTVLASYRAGGDEPKLIEVDRAKTVVWTHRDPRMPGIHHVQILDTDGIPTAGKPLR